MNKKAQFSPARKTIYWMIAGFVLTLVMLAAVIIMVGHKNRITSIPPEINAEFISLRFTNIPECFAYQDPVSEKVYMNTIVIEKFNFEQMNNFCYLNFSITIAPDQEKGHKDFNFELELVNAQRKVKTNNYFNVPHFTLKKKVIVYENNIAKEDELLIHTQVSLPHKIIYTE